MLPPSSGSPYCLFHPSWAHTQRVKRAKPSTHRHQKLQSHHTWASFLGFWHNLQSCSKGMHCSKHSLAVEACWVLLQGHTSSSSSITKGVGDRAVPRNNQNILVLCRASLTAFNAQGQKWKDHQSLIMSANNIHIYVLNTVTILQFSTMSQHTESKVCIFMECIQGNSTTVIQFVITHPDFFLFFFFLFLTR